MATPALSVPDVVRRKALAQGDAGRDWLDSLPTLVDRLACEWGLEPSDVLAGGTEALVIGAGRIGPREAVLKIPPPYVDPRRSELRTLLAGDGRGYAEVLAHDQATGAMLLERLGPTLRDLGLPIHEQIEILCQTLREAWRMPPPGQVFMTGAEKAKALMQMIEVDWLELGRPCARRTVDLALAFAAERRQAFDCNGAVLAHGDPHAWNALLLPGPGPRRFKLVDPDGIFVEPAYDLAIPMREWSAQLLAGDPAALGLARCRQLSGLTGIAPGPIWRWGFVERVATGLLCVGVGLKGGRDMLAVADAWAGAEPP